MSMKNGDSHTSWHPYGHRNVTPFNAETLKFEAEAMCLEENVQLLYGVQTLEVRKTPAAIDIRELRQRLRSENVLLDLPRHT